MVKSICVAVIMACLFSAQSAFATAGVGGPCPSGANYTSLTNPPGALITLASYGITSCYFVAANGADTNNGTSESTPWLHAPQMPNCSAKCATLQNQYKGIPAGTGLILRGGDKWHVGIKVDSSGNPSTGGTWEFNSGQSPEGTSAHPIYLGVDPAWYAGGTWARPILTGDNPLCNSSTLSSSCLHNSNSGLDEDYYVTSCAYQNGTSNNRLLDLNFSGVYYIVDNFELTGLCQSSQGQAGHNDDYIDIASLQGPSWFLNDYIHGWSHMSFGGNNGGSGCTGSTVCFNIFAFNGSTIANGPPSETFLKDVIDGADSDPGALGFCMSGAYNTAYSVILYTSQCIANDFHLFHDNIYGDFYENGHSNMLESNNDAETVGTNAMYNNVFMHLQSSGNGHGGVGILLSPPTGTTDYVFNNLSYDWGPMEIFNIGTSNGAAQGPVVVFNNTWQTKAGVMESIIGCPPSGASAPSTFINNHYILDNTSAYSNYCSGGNTPATATNLQHSNAAANANTSPKFNQYNLSEAFVYSPVTSTNSTVGTGTNEQPYCSALSTAASSDSTLSDAALACQNDIPYRCGYVTSTHSVSCQSSTSIVARPASAAWDIGAYQMPPSAPNPPKNPNGVLVQ